MTRARVREQRPGEDGSAQPTRPHPAEALRPVERRVLHVAEFAERYRWPDGIADRLTAVIREFPHWSVWFFERATPGVPAGGFVAWLADPWIGYNPRLVATSADELARLVAAEDEVRQDRSARCWICGHKLPDTGAEGYADPWRPPKVPP